MIERTGNLFDTELLHIGHGVNVYGMMGAGIAREFKRRFPKNFDRYHFECRKLMLKPGGSLMVFESDKMVHNIASQDAPGANAKYVWLASALHQAAQDVVEFDTVFKMAIPEIGCGIGGLKWGAVETIVREIEDITGVEFEVWHYDG